ncbi:metallopeptidase TldD-related protein [Congregibacter variabilis]|uniref:Metallopeptidase TldD-related protein n=1 Tax=Congregibacter variabilis TaxID=3081200 RepID=A0ABZ0HYW7_9GAMM|nr:metallopeptidase TldD-related protein [Congregibacter sp. IMCC43200]
MEMDPKVVAEAVLQQMHGAGFDDSQVSARAVEQDEINIAHNEASLLRSTQDYDVAITGILDGRKASTSLSDVSQSAIAQAIETMRESVSSAPQDEANAVSQDQHDHFEQGPLVSDRELMASKAIELLDFRKNNTPKIMIEEMTVSHRLSNFCQMSSRGTALFGKVGSYELSCMCIANEAGKTSSMNYSGGRSNDLDSKDAADWFGLGEMLRDTERQIHTRSAGGRFTGEVVLAPTAVSDLIQWLLQQLGSQALISGSSCYRELVDSPVAAKELFLHSDFAAPGHAPFSGDGFVAAPLTLIDAGRLKALLPDLYGSRKTGLTHVPSTSGWRIDPGKRSREDLIAEVKEGALVTRFSMGMPAANGDFSGIIKNSFIIEDGRVGEGLAETMVTGNMAQMLKDVSGISREHISYGGEDYPWLRIPGLHFS